MKTKSRKSLFKFITTVLGVSTLLSVNSFNYTNAGNMAAYSGINDKDEVLYKIEFVNSGVLDVVEVEMFSTGYNQDQSTFVIHPGNITAQKFDVNFENGVPIDILDLSSDNVLRNHFSTILGGTKNTINSDNITILGGEHVFVGSNSDNAVVMGGLDTNLAGGSSSQDIPNVLLGGYNNKIDNQNSDSIDGSNIIGGNGNTISKSKNARILGGQSNQIGSEGEANTIVAGKNVKANYSRNSFVFSNQNTDFTPKDNNAFFLNTENSKGGVSFRTGGKEESLSTLGAVSLSPITIADDTRYPCNSSNADNIGVIGVDGGCFVGCTASGAQEGKWSLLSISTKCSEWCQENDTKCEQYQKAPREEYTSFCTGQAIENAHICSTVSAINTSQANDIFFQNHLVEKCPTSVPDIEVTANKCVWECNDGYSLVDEECHLDCTLPWKGERNNTIKIKHNQTVTGYKKSSPSCENGTERCESTILKCVDGNLITQNGNGEQNSSIVTVPGLPAIMSYKFGYEKCALVSATEWGIDSYNKTVITAENTASPRLKVKQKPRDSRFNITGKNLSTVYTENLGGDFTIPGSVFTGYHANVTGNKCEQYIRYDLQGCIAGYTYDAERDHCFKSCTWNGQTKKHGESVVGYKYSSELCGEGRYCEKKTLTCYNGSFGADAKEYSNTSCTMQEQTCAGYNLNTCPEGGVCSYCKKQRQAGELCLPSHETKVRLDYCKEGYTRVADTCQINCALPWGDHSTLTSDGYIPYNSGVYAFEKTEILCEDGQFCTNSTNRIFRICRKDGVLDGDPKYNKKTCVNKENRFPDGYIYTGELAYATCQGFSGYVLKPGSITTPFNSSSRVKTNGRQDADSNNFSCEFQDTIYIPHYKCECNQGYQFDKTKSKCVPKPYCGSSNGQNACEAPAYKIGHVFTIDGGTIATSQSYIIGEKDDETYSCTNTKSTMNGDITTYCSCDPGYALAAVSPNYYCKKKPVCSSTECEVGTANGINNDYRYDCEVTGLSSKSCQCPDSTYAYSASNRKCMKKPVCAGGGGGCSIGNPSGNNNANGYTCNNGGLTPDYCTCPSGYAYSTSQRKCVEKPVCDSNGSGCSVGTPSGNVNSGDYKCNNGGLTPADCKCSGGYAYSSQEESCWPIPVCGTTSCSVGEVSGTTNSSSFTCDTNGGLSKAYCSCPANSYYYNGSCHAACYHGGTNSRTYHYDNKTFWTDSICPTLSESNNFSCYDGSWYPSGIDNYTKGSATLTSSAGNCENYDGYGTNSTMSNGSSAICQYKKTSTNGCTTYYGYTCNEGYKWSSTSKACIEIPYCNKTLPENAITHEGTPTSANQSWVYDATLTKACSFKCDKYSIPVGNECVIPQKCTLPGGGEANHGSIYTGFTTNPLACTGTLNSCDNIRGVFSCYNGNWTKVSGNAGDNINDYNKRSCSTATFNNCGNYAFSSTESTTNASGVDSKNGTICYIEKSDNNRSCKSTGIKYGYNCKDGYSWDGSKCVNNKCITPGGTEKSNGSIYTGYINNSLSCKDPNASCTASRGVFKCESGSWTKISGTYSNISSYSNTSCSTNTYDNCSTFDFTGSSTTNKDNVTSTAGALCYVKKSSDSLTCDGNSKIYGYNCDKNYEWNPTKKECVDTRCTTPQGATVNDGDYYTGFTQKEIDCKNSTPSCTDKMGVFKCVSGSWNSIGSTVSKNINSFNELSCTRTAWNECDKYSFTGSSSTTTISNASAGTLCFIDKNSDGSACKSETSGYWGFNCKTGFTWDGTNCVNNKCSTPSGSLVDNGAIYTGYTNSLLSCSNTGASCNAGIGVFKCNGGSWTKLSGANNNISTYPNTNCSTETYDICNNYDFTETRKTTSKSNTESKNGVLCYVESDGKTCKTTGYKYGYNCKDGYTWDGNSSCISTSCAKPNGGYASDGDYYTGYTDAVLSCSNPANKCVDGKGVFKCESGKWTKISGADNSISGYIYTTCNTLEFNQCNQYDFTGTSESTTKAHTDGKPGVLCYVEKKGNIECEDKDWLYGFNCDSGYSWNGSSCVADSCSIPGGGTANSGDYYSGYSTGSLSCKNPEASCAAKKGVFRCVDGSWSKISGEVGKDSIYNYSYSSCTTETFDECSKYSFTGYNATTTDTNVENTEGTVCYRKKTSNNVSCKTDDLIYGYKCKDGYSWDGTKCKLNGGATCQNLGKGCNTGGYASGTNGATFYKCYDKDYGEEGETCDCPSILANQTYYHSGEGICKLKENDLCSLDEVYACNEGGISKNNKTITGGNSWDCVNSFDEPEQCIWCNTELNFVREKNKCVCKDGYVLNGSECVLANRCGSSDYTCNHGTVSDTGANGLIATWYCNSGASAVECSGNTGCRRQGMYFYISGTQAVNYSVTSQQCTSTTTACSPIDVTCNNGKWVPNNPNIPVTYADIIPSCSTTSKTCDEDEYPHFNCPIGQECSKCHVYNSNGQGCDDGGFRYRWPSDDEKHPKIGVIGVLSKNDTFQGTYYGYKAYLTVAEDIDDEKYKGMHMSPVDIDCSVYYQYTFGGYRMGEKTAKYPINFSFNADTLYDGAHMLVVVVENESSLPDDMIDVDFMDLSCQGEGITIEYP